MEGQGRLLGFDMGSDNASNPLRYPFKQLK